MKSYVGAILFSSLPILRTAARRLRQVFTLGAFFAAGAASAGEPVELPPKKNVQVYLLMGQSNMAGRDRRELESQDGNPRVLALGEDNQWTVARDPMHGKRGRILPGVGPGIPFALEMLKADPDVTIGLVPCAVGGSSLGPWEKGAKHYEKALERARLAAENGVISGVLWHQGESDSYDPQNAESYGARLAKMFQDLRRDLDAPHLPIVVGQLGDFLEKRKFPHAETVRAAIRRMPDKLERVGYADSSGLGHKGDRLHFDAQAARKLGQRFAKAMRELQK